MAGPALKRLMAEYKQLLQDPPEGELSKLLTHRRFRHGLLRYDCRYRDLHAYMAGHVVFRTVDRFHGTA